MGLNLVRIFGKFKYKQYIPYIPLIGVFIALIMRPYYVFPLCGDDAFHLMRAREILESPLYGLFWDYLNYYPLGRALWHPPLFHAVYAFLWWIGGIRFAHSFMCISGVLITVGVASWISKREYGIIAGFFAGLFALSVPRVDILTMALPANLIPVFAVLTIYFLPKNKLKAAISSLLGIWTHMIGLIVFVPLFFVDNSKNWKNLKLMAPLLISEIFWIAYWIYFSGKTGATNELSPSLQWNIPLMNVPSLILILIFGIIGLYFLYKIDYRRFKLMSAYILIVLLVQFLFADIARGFQYAALPLAILSGITVQKGYEYVSNNYKNIFTIIFIILMLIFSLIGSSPFFVSLADSEITWNDLNIPFDDKYAPVVHYIESNTNENEVLWTDSSIAENIAWMTGRKISNGEYGMPKEFIETHQGINIYYSNGTFLIKHY